MRATHLRFLVPAVAIAASLSMLLLAAPSPAASPTVYINGDSSANYKFTPGTANIGRRTKVNWLWDSNSGHNVTFKKLGKSSATGASETFQLRFKRRGTFKYLCTVHGFRGKVVVR